MRCLYILDLNPLLVASFAKIFSHSLECLFFFLFMFSFAVPKLLSLIRSYWLIFVFIVIVQGDGSNKISLQFMSKSVLPLFSSRCFTVSSLLFRFLIHFEFLCMVLRECSTFILFTCSYPVFLAPLVEEAPLYILDIFLAD